MSSQAPHIALPTFTPVPRLKDRSNGWKPEVQHAFIEALADTGSVASACRAVRRSAHGTYHLRRQPGAEEFAAAWEAAFDIGMQRIEDTAMDRALNGVEVPVYSYGKLIGSRIAYNDRLLMFMLRNRAPHRFAEGRSALRAGGPDAIDKMELARLKKQWRAEWEADYKRAAALKAVEQEDEAIRTLTEKLSVMTERRKIGLSPRTLAAESEAERLRQLDEETGYSGLTDPEHPNYIDPKKWAEETEVRPLPPHRNGVRPPRPKRKPGTERQESGGSRTMGGSIRAFFDHFGS